MSIREAKRIQPTTVLVSKRSGEKIIVSEAKFLPRNVRYSRYSSMVIFSDTNGNKYMHTDVCLPMKTPECPYLCGWGMNGARN